MSRRERIWVGADPGGKGNFGLAILGAGGSARTWSVDCADEAVELITEHLDTAPSGVGVDAPLWWSSGRSGDRLADQWLRKTYGLSGGKVQASNSLQGAALVQGAMFVYRIRQRLRDVPVTETHPKALLSALKVSEWDLFAKRFGLDLGVDMKPGHERDAVISAVAAREGFEGRWARDLSASRHACEQDPSSYWLAEVHYYWPET